MMTTPNADDSPARPGRAKRVHGPGGAAVPDPFDVSRAETQSDFIVVCGPDHTVLYANPAFARAMGYAAETMAGTPLLPYIAKENRETMTANLAALEEMSDPPFYETTLLAGNGLRRSVIVKGKAVRYNDKPATLLFLIDITERKALEDLLRARAEELQQISTSLRLANKKLNLLSSITRHDIDNQLTGLKFFLEVLVTEERDPALAEYCRKAQTSVDQIAAMIRFTREYEEIGITAPAWQDCRAIADTAAHGAPPGKVVVRNDIPAGREVFADPLIARVFYNLMDNAVRYGQKITTIRFFLEEHDGQAVIVCEDDGVGVPAGDKERIFDKGFGKNTGLGLALSREILDITGITITETGTPGAGARFEITVPAGSCRLTGAH
ncbi:MAG: HAMP domain-containing histidine kinase [Methanoregula sp.]|jgi:PAS domain S-box-containing protein|nr:HAMP domain-containing histidine kinase [Methanoregula sp.]